jgi:HlyD family secretion protein
MSRKAQYVVIGAVLIGTAIAVLTVRARQAQQTSEFERSAVVQRGPMLVAITASGSIEPASIAGLALESPGRVASVFVEVGDAVAAGDQLLALDSRQLALRVHQSEAALASAKADLMQVEAGSQPEEIVAAEARLSATQARVAAAAASLDQLKAGADAAQIAEAEAQVASARLQREVAQDTYDLTKDREKTEKEQAAYDLYASGEALAAAEAYLEDLLAGPNSEQVRELESSLAEAVAQRDAAQAHLDQLVAGPSQEKIDAAESQVEQAGAALELAELTLRKATLRAPFRGVVAAVDAMVGEAAAPSVSAVTLIDDSKFHVTVSVDEIEVGRLAEGQEAVVTLEALPEEEIEGYVERIAPAARFEAGVVYYDVRIGLRETGVPVRADMTANATIVVEELKDVLQLPTGVVRVDRLDGQTYVDREVEGETERVDVKLGLRYGGNAQVLEGLEEGDRVVWVAQGNGFLFGQQE